MRGARDWTFTRRRWWCAQSRPAIRKTFGTVTRQLLQMIDWLIESGVTHVAMESTGSYWKPLFNLLENTDLEVLVANPRYMRAVPGRKTDVKDAEWIADLLCHGLLRASFIPSREQRELRELVRYHKVLGQERATNGQSSREGPRRWEHQVAVGGE